MKKDNWILKAFLLTFLIALIFNTFSNVIINKFDNILILSLLVIIFILIGIMLIFGNFYKFKEYIVKNRAVFYILTLITGMGVIIVGLIHGGNPFTLGYHMLGAMMAILGGNILLVVVSRSMEDFGTYQKLTLALGVFGLIVFWIMFFNMELGYMPVFERLSVYTMIIWSFLTGVYILGNSD